MNSNLQMEEEVYRFCLIAGCLSKSQLRRYRKQIIEFIGDE